MTAFQKSAPIDTLKRDRALQDVEPGWSQAAAGIPPDVRAILFGTSDRTKAERAVNTLSFARVVGDNIEVATGANLDFHWFANNEGALVIVIAKSGAVGQQQLREFKKLEQFAEFRQLGVKHAAELHEMVRDTGGGNVWVIT